MEIKCNLISVCFALHGTYTLISTAQILFTQLVRRYSTIEWKTQVQYILDWFMVVPLRADVFRPVGTLYFGTPVSSCKSLIFDKNVLRPRKKNLFLEQWFDKYSISS